jgi:hypothetical protein
VPLILAYTSSAKRDEVPIVNSIAITDTTFLNRSMARLHSGFTLGCVWGDR